MLSGRIAIPDKAVLILFRDKRRFDWRRRSALPVIAEIFDNVPRLRGRGARHRYEHATAAIGKRPLTINYIAATFARLA
jgi:hypothetical protein